MPFPSEFIAPPSKQIFTVARCGLCGLYKRCSSPKMKVDGNGRRKILIVGEAPGATEDKQGKPLVGKSGTYLSDCLDQIGINMRNDCWLTNALLCRPPNNRTPTSEEIGYCQPNVAKAIRDLKPEIILTVGKAGIESVVSGLWTEDVGPMARWAGWQIPSVDLNAWILPTYHPSYVLRELDMNERSGTPIERIYLDQLEAVTKFSGHPYGTPPDYQKKIEVVHETEVVISFLKKIIQDGGPFAIDYETECLKPDRGGRIITASVCWRGMRTMAFPWGSKSVEKWWVRLLQSPNLKIGHNAKYEQRWSRRRWGIEVVFDWCTMVGAHMEDNRRGVCSLGFQTFVKLGVRSYYDEVHKFLEQKNSYDKNNINRADQHKLLVYNGMDSLMTFLIANKQRRHFKKEPY